MRPMIAMDGSSGSQGGGPACRCQRARTHASLALRVSSDRFSRMAGRSEQEPQNVDMSDDNSQSASVFRSATVSVTRFRSR